jgi:superkiller protein 3
MFRAPALMLLSATLCAAQMGRGELEITTRIVLEDGTPLTTSPLISLRVPGSTTFCSGEEFFMGGTLRLRIPPVMIQGEPQTGCQISVIVEGYRKFTGYVNDGTVITLHRIGPNEGSSISIASLNAPPTAKKEYEIGEALAGKKKWPLAEEHFRNATVLYPRYALAWSELGQAEQEQGRIPDAISDFTKAHQADPAYIKPVVQLAAAASVQKNWDEEMHSSEEAMKMHPVEFPAAYFYFAEATFHLGKLEDAEKLTREAIQLDPAGTCIETLVLLGAIFEKQGNNQDALIEYKNYLKLAPHGLRADEAKEAVARLKHAG